MIKSFFFLFITFASITVSAQDNILQILDSPIIFQGNDSTAYRDPALLFHDNIFYLFFTMVKSESDSKVYSYTAMSTSKDLKKWSDKKILTPRDQNLDYSSPGNVIRYNDEWILCLQTYPRPDYFLKDMPKFGTGDARLFIMRSKDLVSWSSPELLKVKGLGVPEKDMGRMIDPYLLEDKDEKGKWWCFYKQNGVSMSYTYDFENWTYFGHTESGENVSVLRENDEYILIHSPKNGIAIKKSKDFKNWTDFGNLITLGQKQWTWAKGRISAGTVINLIDNPDYGSYVMFFHGSGPLTEEEGDFDKNASLGISWSKDLLDWEWPRK
jgi:beta-xylosidase